MLGRVLCCQKLPPISVPIGSCLQRLCLCVPSLESCLLLGLLCSKAEETNCPVLSLQHVHACSRAVCSILCTPNLRIAPSVSSETASTVAVNLRQKSNPRQLTAHLARGGNCATSTTGRSCQYCRIRPGRRSALPTQSWPDRDGVP